MTYGELYTKFDALISQFAIERPELVSNPMWNRDSIPRYQSVRWPLLGPQVTNVGMTEITYECVILQDITQIVICNGVYITCKTLDQNFSELIPLEFTQRSDTCIEFNLPKYYNPILYEFYLSAVVKKNE